MIGAFMLSLLSIGCLTLNILFFEHTWFGIVSLLLYIGAVSRCWQPVYKKVFGFTNQEWIQRAYSVFTVFFLLTITSGICVWVYRLTEMGVIEVFVLVAILSWIVGRRGEQSKVKSLKSKVGVDIDINIDAMKKMCFKPRLFLVCCYVFLWIITLFLFIKSGNDQSVLQTPWQTLNMYILPLMFVMMVLLGILLLSKFKTKGLLLLLVAHSFLLHLYLPLSHELPWGGDVWRHIAVEKQLLGGESILPVLIGPEAVWREVLGADIPDVFVKPQKYSYGQLWGSTVLLSHTLQVDLETLNKWFLPVLWSLFFPFLIYQLGVVLFSSKRMALWLVFLSFIPFSLQAVGSLTLPVSLGLLGFLFALTLWLQYVKTGNIWQRRIALSVGLLLLFGYTLYAFLWLFVIGVTGVLRLIGEKSKVTNWKAMLLISICILISMLIIPAIELISGISHIPTHWSFVQALKQVIGQFTGWYYVSAIRPHDIMSGNILFNHTPEWAYVRSVFTEWRWYVIPIMLLLWVSVKYGFWQVFYRESSLVSKVVGLLTTMVLGGYVLGWFVLEGDRLLTRRLDPVMSVLLIAFLLYGVLRHISRSTYHVSKRLVLMFSLAAVFILSFFATTSYASGPDMPVVSVEQKSAAEYIWNNSDHFAEQYCVLADAWTLLALEAISGGKIIGGGFPIDYQFGQVERERVLNEIEIKNEMSLDDLRQSLQADTGAESCFVVLHDIDSGNKLFGRPIGWFGEISLWRIQL